MKKQVVGFAMCGSFCTFSKTVEQIQKLCECGYDVVPIMSENAYSTDTRFGKAKDFINQIEDITSKKVLYKIEEVEPIGPKNLLDTLIILPCTGNTLGKLANGITDTSVTMAAKAVLRNESPVIIGISTNDALGASSRNIGILLNTKNIFFIPYRQDDYIKKPKSLVCDFQLCEGTVALALKNQQIQPIIK